MRYRKAPILEAVLEFRWASPRSLDELRAILKEPAFAEYDDVQPRVLVDAQFDVSQEEFSHNRHDVGFEIAHRDGSLVAFLEVDKFAFIQKAPYDQWRDFSANAMSLLGTVVRGLGIEEFSRVGVRFVNRIDVPHESEDGFDTDEYVTVSFDGPRKDIGKIEEFQMRVVKPTVREGIHYALVIGTTTSPLPDHGAILVDIDVFTRTATRANEEELMRTLDEMRLEKNQIFEECLRAKARSLFGGVLE